MPNARKRTVPASWKGRFRAIQWHYGVPRLSESESISSEEIGRFLFGIMIAMVGSLTGLGLTVLGNNLLKDARVTRNERKKDYYNFLRIELLPVLNTDMQKGMGDLKAVLDAFNQGFFGKIETQLFAKLNQILPLMSKIEVVE